MDRDVAEDDVAGQTACWGLSGLFYSDDALEVTRAKAICRGCPLRSRCLEGAISRREEFGVWGGFTTPERKLWTRYYPGAVPDVVPEMPKPTYIGAPA